MPRVAPVVTALLLAAAGACGGGEPEAPAAPTTFSSFVDRGVSFEYPAEWNACAYEEGGGTTGLRAGPGEMPGFVGPLEARLENAGPVGLGAIVRDQIAQSTFDPADIVRKPVDVPGATRAVALTFQVREPGEARQPISGDLFALSEDGVLLHLLWLGAPYEAGALQAAFDRAVETLRMDTAQEDRLPEEECELPPSPLPEPEVETAQVPAKLAGKYAITLGDEQMDAAVTNRDRWTMTIEGDTLTLEGIGPTGKTRYTFLVLAARPPRLVLDTGSCAGVAGSSTLEYGLGERTLVIVDVDEACPELEALLTLEGWDKTS